MKKSVKALLCAALLTAGGGNFCMALGSGEEDSSLSLEGLEALAYSETDPQGNYYTWGGYQEDSMYDSQHHLKSKVVKRVCDEKNDYYVCMYYEECTASVWNRDQGDITNTASRKCPSWARQ